MTPTPPTDPAMREAFEEDCQHLVDCLRGAILDGDETSLRALLSNNVNTIIHALKSAATQAHARAEMEACLKAAVDVEMKHLLQRCREAGERNDSASQGHAVEARDMLARVYAALAEPQPTGAGEG